MLCKGCNKIVLTSFYANQIGIENRNSPGISSGNLKSHPIDIAKGNRLKLGVEL
jgi:hypothetical protein